MHERSSILNCRVAPSFTLSVNRSRSWTVRVVTFAEEHHLEIGRDDRRRPLSSETPASIEDPRTDSRQAHRRSFVS